MTQRGALSYSGVLQGGQHAAALCGHGHISGYTPCIWPVIAPPQMPGDHRTKCMLKACRRLAPLLQWSVTA